MKFTQSVASRVSRRLNERGRDARATRHVQHVERLERLLLRAADPVISEFLAKNSGSVLDGYGLESDWIEIHNQGDAAVNLQGWHLTDDLSSPAKWTFPSKTLAAGARMVVFASGKNATDPSGNLHTNFSLSDDGERLALVKPDLTVVSAYSTSGNYPAQFADVSYGIGKIYQNTQLVGGGTAVKAFVPTNGAIDNGTWVQRGYNDSSWTSGIGGVGFDTGAYEDNSTVPVLKANWDADTITGVANGAAINNWASSVGGAVATASGSPIYRSSLINGHAAIQFVPSNGVDNLRVAAASNPMSGIGDFTMAVVFRANAGTGTVSGSSNYNNHAGIVDGELGSPINDWGTSIAAGGRVAAGVATPTRTVYSPNGVNYADGQAHVLVFTRRGGVLTLYVDGGDGITRTDASAAARAVGDMVFGSSQQNSNYLNGDIAQVMVYGGAASVGRAYQTAQTLGNKYGVSIATPTVAEMPQVIASWNADSFNGSLADNAPVGNWVSTANGVTRTATVSGAPRLRKNQINGHSVITFNPADGNDQFRVSSSANPVSGATNFTFAFVFRTSAGGKGGVTDWYNNTGIIDAEQGGITNDWGTGIDASGRIAGGSGNPDDTIYSQAGLNDGKAHVVVYSKDGDRVRMSIDGGVAQEIAAGSAARNTAEMVMGSIQTNVGDSYYTGDLAAVQFFSGGYDSDTMRSIAGTLASTYNIPLAPSPFSKYIGTDLGAAMAGNASTAALRYAFTVDGDASRFDRLTLGVRYDDGFVAYLNGAEIARRNAPGGTITYASTASGQRLDGDALAAESIDVSAFRSLLLGDGQTNVLAIRALNLSATDGDFLLSPTLTASIQSVGEAYFTTPTPGAANGDGLFGKLASPTFSKQHGYYSGTQSLTIAGATPGATLVYTLDGSEPTLENGIVVTAANASSVATATITFSKTTNVRAASFKDAYLASPVAASSYIFYSSIATQTNTAPAGAYWGTAVDQRLINGTVPNQGFTVEQALKSIPSVSLTMNWDEMFGSGGLYQNPTQKGRAWERETSIEYFDPNKPGDAGFSVNAGIRIQGGSSRDTNKPKKSFRIYFRSEYGLGQLDYPLFRSGAVTTKQDKFVLRAFNNQSWANEPDVGNTDFIHDQWARRLQAQVEGRAAAVDGQFVQLYINGQYWGLYTLDEDPDDAWAANHFGGEDTDYEVVEPDGAGGIELKTDLAEGETSLWSQLVGTFTSAMGDGTISDAEYATIRSKMDVQSLINFMVNDIYRGDRDSPVVIWNRRDPRNFYAYVNKNEGQYKFVTWDGELSMDDLYIDKTDVNNEAPYDGGHDGPGYFWMSLRTNNEFKQQVVDTLYKTFYNGGPLEVNTATGVNKPRELYDSIKAEVNAAVVGESFRWGSWNRGYPLLRVNDWLNAVNNKYSYLNDRSSIVMAQFRNDFPAFGRLPPIFRIGGGTTRGGKVAVGTAITLADVNGSIAGDVIYYTLDGTDPRTAGGGVAASAQIYTGPITLNASKTITVRILNGTTWSPIDRVAFSVDAAATAANLAVTELHYHPANITPAELAVNPAFTEDDFDYIEFMNTSAASVSLLGLTFSAGISGTLADAAVAPGERVVVVKNEAAFRARFGSGPRVVGVYGGALSNSGETVTIKAADGSTIKSFTYSDGSAGDGWSVRADGDGSSLEVVNLNGDYNSPANWRPSYAYEGTPAAAPIAAPTQDVVVNEIVGATADGVDRIELYNRSGSALNIGGWYLADGGGIDWMIPLGTSIAAGGYAVFTSSDWASAAGEFTVSGAAGGWINLIRSSGTTPLGFADAISYGGSAVGESLGRVPNGTGELYPIATPTLGVANGAPRIGPATITEVMYKPAGGDLNLEYIEVQNQTNDTLDLSGWKLANGVTFTVPSGTALGAYEVALFVHFNPTTDTAAAAAFRAAYGLPSSIKLIGPFAGDLAGGGEQLTLLRPDAPQASEPGVTPLVTVDDFTYGTGAPWPSVAAGQALTRLSNQTYGRATTNWTATAPSAGEVDYGNAYFGLGSSRVISGTLSYDSVTVANGTTLTLSGSSSVLRTGGLSLVNGGELDLGSGTLVIDYASGVTSPLSTVQAWLSSGRNGGAWNGTGGIRSSAAAATAGHTLGWGEASTIPAGVRNTFSSTAIDDTSVIVRFTRNGDVDLSRTVDFGDLLTLAKNYNASGKSFTQGNVDGDGAGLVGFSDLLLLAKNYNAAATLPAAASATVELAGGSTTRAGARRSMAEQVVT